MDEPFASLDAQTRELMQSELLAILTNSSVGVVFVTHQIEEALYLADRVVVLSGRPARISSIVEVTFPRPRDLDTKRSAEFQELLSQIWRDIEEDVLRAMSEQSSLSASPVK
jgi:NitT/TauT family transport system ATP-binding protein